MGDADFTPDEISGIIAHLNQYPGEADKLGPNARQHPAIAGWLRAHAPGTPGAWIRANPNDPAIAAYRRQQGASPNEPTRVTTVGGSQFDPSSFYAQHVVPNALPLGGQIAGGLALGALSGGNPWVARLGSAIGGAAGEAGNQALGITQPSVGQIAAAGAAAPLGELAGRALVGGPVRLMGDVAPAPAPGAGATAQAFRETGVPLKPTDVSSSPFWAATENFLRMHPFARPSITELAGRQGQALNTAAKDFLTTLGLPLAAKDVATGQALSRALERNVAAFRKTETALWDDVADLATSSGVRVDITPLRRMAQRILDEQAQLLPSQRNHKLIKQATQIVGTGIPDVPAEFRGVALDPSRILSGGGVTKSGQTVGGSPVPGALTPDTTVPWSQVRAWQKSWGQTLNRQTGLLQNIPEGEAKALWEAATESLQSAAASASPIVAAFQRARAFSAQGNALYRDSALAKVMELPPEKVVGMLERGGPSLVRDAKMALLGDPNVSWAHAPAPEDVGAWNLLRRHILEGVLSPAEEGGVIAQTKGVSVPMISSAKLTQRLAGIGQETLDQLLSPAERRALGNIVTVAKAVRSGESLGQSSQSITAQQAGFGAAFGSLGALAGYATGHPATGTAVGFLSYLMLPTQVAKLVTSPGLAEIIASTGFGRAMSTFARTGQLTVEGAKIIGQIGAGVARTETTTSGSALQFTSPAPPVAASDRPDPLGIRQ